MKLLKHITNKFRKFNQELDNKSGITWIEYRQQWLLENGSWNCKKN